MTATSDSYCTPHWLADRVGVFATDPCTNSRSHIIANTKYMLPSNGLILPWYGRTWMNHPYSDPLPWVMKLHYERAMQRCTESLVLAKLDTSTEWWGVLTDPQHGPCDLWAFRKRINHDIPPELLAEMQAKWEAKGGKGKVNTSNNFCSALIHHRGAAPALQLHDVAQLWRIDAPGRAFPTPC